jgi:hypothetical protein
VERVDGVREAWFSYNTAEGFVTFDTTMISPTEFIGELERMTAFTATLREEDDGPSRRPVEESCFSTHASKATPSGVHPLFNAALTHLYNTVLREGFFNFKLS